MAGTDRLKDVDLKGKGKVNDLGMIEKIEKRKASKNWLIYIENKMKKRCHLFC